MAKNIPYTISDYQASLLSQIFRIITKEITSDDDKYKLAPGEIGINYTEGAFYIKNPNTGELFSPNSVAHIKQIMSKFDPVTNELNADLLNKTKLYTDMSQLSRLSISYTPDTVIREMASPSVLFAPVQYDNYKYLGYPSNNGTMLAIKINEDFVIAHYYDANANSIYNGKYEQKRHYFIGWELAGGAPEPVYTETISGGVTPEVTIQNTPYDLMIMSVLVKHKIEPNAVLYINNTRSGPIVLIDKTPLSTQIDVNNTIKLIYDKREASWVMIKPTDSTIAAIVEIVRRRVDEITIDYDAKIADLYNRIELVHQRIDDIVEDYDDKFADVYNKFEQVGQRIDSVVTDYTQKIDAANTRITTLDDRISAIVETYDAKFVDVYTKFDTMKADYIKRIGDVTTDYLQRFSDMKREYDAAISELKARPGNIITCTSTYIEPVGDNDTVSTIDQFVPTLDKLVVNYSQTILRSGTDYDVSGNGIKLKNGIKLAKDDKLFFIVIKQAEMPTA